MRDRWQHLRRGVPRGRHVCGVADRCLLSGGLLSLAGKLREWSMKSLAALVQMWNLPYARASDSDS
jgi:hypothetical protein